MSNKAEYRQLASSTRRGNKTTLNARGTHIIIPETHAIFAMSAVLKATRNLDAHILNVNANPNSF